MTTTLTFAELAFLLSEADADARARLQVHQWERADAIVASGGASLVARQLLLESDGELNAHETLIPILECLAEPTAWVSIGSVREHDAEEMHIFEGPPGRITATVLPYGAYEICGADTATPVPQAVSQLVGQFIDQEEPGAVFLCRLPTEPENGLAIRRSAEGTVEVALGQVESADVRKVDRAEALDLVESFLA